MSKVITIICSSKRSLAYKNNTAEVVAYLHNHQFRPGNNTQQLKIMNPSMMENTNCLDYFFNSVSFNLIFFKI